MKGAAGLSETPRRVFGATDPAPQVPVVSGFKVIQRGSYVARFGIKYVRNGETITLPPFSGDVQAGTTGEVDLGILDRLVPGESGLPDKTVFWPYLQVVGGNTVDSAQRFQYTTGAARAMFVSDGLSASGTTFEFTGLAATSAPLVPDVSGYTVIQRGGYIARFGFRFVRDGETITVPPFGSDVPAGTTREVDLRFSGLPDGTVFWPYLQVVGGNTVDSTQRFRYKTGTAKATFVSGGLSANGTFEFTGLPAAAAPLVGGIRFDNRGPYIAHYGFRYIDNLGTEVSTNVSGDINQYQTQLIDPGRFGVPEGATFRAFVKIVAGAEKLGSQTFLYRSSSQTFGQYLSGGDSLTATFDFAGLSGEIETPQGAELKDRQVTFGLAEGERFSVEGFIRATAGGAPLVLGGIEGLRASRDEKNGKIELRPVFSYDEVHDKFLEDYSFETEIDGMKVTIRWYFIVE